MRTPLTSPRDMKTPSRPITTQNKICSGPASSVLNKPWAVSSSRVIAAGSLSASCSPMAAAAFAVSSARAAKITSSSRAWLSSGGSSPITVSTMVRVEPSSATFL